MLIPGIALGLPIMDTLLAIGRRAIRGRPLFQADKEHIHHKLMDLGLTHRQAVLVLYGFCMLLGAVAMVLTYSNSLQAALLLVVLMLVAFFFLRSLGYVRSPDPGSAVDRKRNRGHARHAPAAWPPPAADPRRLTEMWPVVVEAATALGAVRSACKTDLPGTAVRLSVRRPSTDVRGRGSIPLFRFRFTVPGGKATHRTLELGWSDGRAEIDRDIEIAAEIFCEHLGEALDLTQERRPLQRPGAPTAIPRRAPLSFSSCERNLRIGLSNGT